MNLSRLFLGLFLLSWIQIQSPPEQRLWTQIRIRIRKKSFRIRAARIWKKT